MVAENGELSARWSRANTDEDEQPSQGEWTARGGAEGEYGDEQADAVP